MNVLIIYASHYGQTQKIAMKIADRLRAQGTQVDTFHATATQQLPSPSAYDAVVFGSRIEFARHAQPIIDYIQKYRTTLQRMPTAYFSVCMAAASPKATTDPDGYMRTLFEKLAWTPTRAAAFAGALPYREYNWFLRFIMKRISKGAGHTTETSRNHEFTNWDAVRGFADELVAFDPMRDHAQVL
jgi:menaquinone-dependent protoporphyrinogen oxidase